MCDTNEYEQWFHTAGLETAITKKKKCYQMEKSSNAFGRFALES